MFYPKKEVSYLSKLNQAFNGEKEILSSKIENFKSIKLAPRDLWIFYIICFLDSLSYFIFSYILMLYLIETLEFTDNFSGVIYGIYGAFISVFFNYIWFNC